MTSEPNHLEKIRERFTATADVFTEYVRTIRVEESEHLAERATAGLAFASEALAIDVACGPGTFTRPFAPRVRRAVGVDLTPAMIEKARAEAARALAEMARVLRPGGRVAIADLIGRDGSGGAIQNAIERARDPSHTNAQSVAQFRALMRDAGLRLLSEESRQRWYDFDLWMRNAGSVPGDASYVQARRMLEEIMGHDTSGLDPRHSETTGGLEFLHTVLLLVAEKSD